MNAPAQALNITVRRYKPWTHVLLARVRELLEIAKQEIRSNYVMTELPQWQ